MYISAGKASPARPTLCPSRPSPRSPAAAAPPPAVSAPGRRRRRRHGRRGWSRGGEDGDADGGERAGELARAQPPHAGGRRTRGWHDAQRVGPRADGLSRQAGWRCCDAAPCAQPRKTKQINREPGEALPLQTGISSTNALLYKNTKTFRKRRIWMRAQARDTPSHRV